MLACVLVCCAFAPRESLAAAEDLYETPDGREVIDMDPGDPAGASVRNIGAGLSMLFGAGAYYNDPRALEVETSPPEGTVDLFYVRNGFQKLYEQGQTPVRVLLPPRARAGPRDVLTLRAFAEGYRQEQRTIPIGTNLASVVIELEPLPNLLSAVSHRYFAGRASLVFQTKELLEPRLQERSDGFAVVLEQTALGSEARATLEATRSPLVDEIVIRQLGEDLVLTVSLSQAARDSAVGLRSRQSYDLARDVHVFGVDLVPGDRGAAGVQRTLGALEAIDVRDVTGCALEFDDVLREGLGSAALSRALEPLGGFTDKSVRAAMRRLGAVSPGGSVTFGDGVEYRTGVALELEVALSQAGEARGFLALLRSLVGGMEEGPAREEALRSLIAPEMSPATFAQHFSAASGAEERCRAAQP